MSRLRDDSGQLTLLVLGYAAVAGLLTVVAVDVSAVFLARRSLVAVADGAAVAGVQSVDRAAVYAGAAAGGSLPLDVATVTTTVAAYARHHPEVEVAGSSPDGRTVVVDARREVPLPFGGLVGIDRVTVTARATARSAIG